jgi:hypothetical protein
MPKPITLGAVSPGEADAECFKTLGVAFENACGKLGIAERSDPQRERVATKVIELARLGERDLDRLTTRTVAAFLH